MKLAIGMGLLLSGCFWLSPIIQRPRVAISRVGMPLESPVRRAEGVMLKATFQPSGHEGTYRWYNAFACDTLGPGNLASGCDDQAFFTLDEDTFAFTVPVNTLASGVLVKAVRVQLDARDDRGALAPSSIPDLAAEDAAPTLELSSVARSSVGASLYVFANYGDPDDAPSGVTLEWKVVAPIDPVVELVDVPPVQPAPNRVTAGKRLVPRVVGPWDIEVTARDPAGVVTTRHAMFTITPDQAPCLAQWRPIEPPPGSVLPISEPTVFQVPLVHDDLDSYPRMSGDPEFGTATFAWSILAPGAAARQPLAGANGNAVDFDPAVFTPGDIVELRVEIFDRRNDLVACPDEQPTCAAGPTPGCLQRQTWRVEVR